MPSPHCDPIGMVAVQLSPIGGGRGGGGDGGGGGGTGGGAGIGGGSGSPGMTGLSGLASGHTHDSQIGLAYVHVPTPLPRRQASVVHVKAVQAAGANSVEGVGGWVVRTSMGTGTDG